mmetsp:Transcript_48280/g.79534  ORF Transcript_48280/g.79534 Transcript_48280/m.79534 type:complete len:232 (+) Transcript_48280:62-757(+)
MWVWRCSWATGSLAWVTPWPPSARPCPLTNPSSSRRARAFCHGRSRRSTKAPTRTRTSLSWGWCTRSMPESWTLVEKLRRSDFVRKRGFILLSCGRPTMQLNSCGRSCRVMPWAVWPWEVWKTRKGRRKRLWSSTGTTAPFGTGVPRSGAGVRCSFPWSLPCRIWRCTKRSDTSGWQRTPLVRSIEAPSTAARTATSFLRPFSPFWTKSRKVVGGQRDVGNSPTCHRCWRC